jgi:hypothetical protein
VDDDEGIVAAPSAVTAGDEDGHRGGLGGGGASAVTRSIAIGQRGGPTGRSANGSPGKGVARTPVCVSAVPDAAPVEKKAVG